MLGLGGATAAITGLGFKSALKADEQFEASGTLWKTHDFEDGVVRLSKEQIDTLPPTVAEYWAQDFSAVQVCTLKVDGLYETGHQGSIMLHGRKVKIGEVIRFKGGEASYTVIETESQNRRHAVSLDRPLVTKVADGTPVYEYKGVSRSIMRSGGQRAAGAVLLEQGDKSIRINGDVQFTYSSGYEPIIEKDWSGQTYIREGHEQPMDVTLDVTIHWQDAAMSVREFLNNADRSEWDDDPCEPPSFRLTVGGDDGETFVFTKCYWSTIDQDTQAAQLSISMRCMKAEVIYA